MAAIDLILIAVPILLLLAGATVVFAQQQRAAAIALAYGGSLVLMAALLALAGGALVGSAEASARTLPLGLPWLGGHLRLDPLAAFVLVLVGLGGAAASLFALGHAPHDPDAARVAPFFPAFLAAMIVVALADDAFTFLVGWESMSLASWPMVLAHHTDAESRRAGVVYLAMAGFGTLALLLAFGLLAGPGGAYDFASMRAFPRPPLAVALGLLLVVLGAGSKAGLVPLHVWLPLAHPVAPSHVSALMSGVMTKLALYAIVRVGFDLLGVAPWWAGMALMIVGGITAVGGILYAMLETDLKRVLACSTIENIGVIAAGLGLALSFRANAMPGLAALALTAALFHMLNHTLFKSLLFLGAGAVLAATGTAAMDRLGGLIHRMRLCAVAFLTGSLAIAALPPLNGFASEWLLFQAILQGPALPQWGLKIAAPAVGALLALAAALAAACFVRAFGVTFLGRPRSAAAAAAAETDRPSLFAMGGLALAAVLAGVLPGLVIDALAPVAAQLAGTTLAPQAANPWLTIMPAGAARGSYNALLVLAFIAASASLAAALVHRFASRAVRRGPAWCCGYSDPVPLNQYGGPSFAQPIRRVFAAPLFAAREHVSMPPPGALVAARYRTTLTDPAWARLFDPITRAVGFAALRLNAAQFLTIRRYLSLVFLSLVGLLLALAVLT